MAQLKRFGKLSSFSSLTILSIAFLFTASTYFSGAESISFDLASYIKGGEGCNNWNNGQPGCFMENSWACKDNYWHIQKCNDGCYINNGTCIGGAKATINALIDLSKHTKGGKGCNNWNGGRLGCWRGNSWGCKDDYWYLQSCSNGCNETSGNCIAGLSSSNNNIQIDLTKYVKGSKSCNSWNSGKAGCFNKNSWVCKDDYWYIKSCNSGCNASSGDCAMSTSIDLADYTRYRGYLFGIPETTQCTADGWDVGKFVCKESYSFVCNTDGSLYVSSCGIKGCDSSSGKCNTASSSAVDLIGYAKGTKGCSNWNDGNVGCWERNSWICKDDYWYKKVCSNGCDSGKCTTVLRAEDEVDESYAVIKPHYLITGGVATQYGSEGRFKQDMLTARSVNTLLKRLNTKVTFEEFDYLGKMNLTAHGAVQVINELNSYGCEQLRQEKTPERSDVLILFVTDKEWNEYVTDYKDSNFNAYGSSDPPGVIVFVRSKSGLPITSTDLLHELVHVVNGGKHNTYSEDLMYSYSNLGPTRFADSSQFESNVKVLKLNKC